MIDRNEDHKYHLESQEGSQSKKTKVGISQSEVGIILTTSNSEFDCILCCGFYLLNMLRGVLRTLQNTYENLFAKIIHG